MYGSETIKSDLIKAIEQINVHDHACLIYESTDMQLAAALPFIKMGLMRDEQCTYIADDNTSDAITKAMNSDGIDVDLAVSSGALNIITKREAYLDQGYFDPDFMIQYLKNQVDSAKKAGFKALRVTGEMTWALGNDTGVERLFEYEAKLNYFFAQNDVLAICQYNSNRFKPEMILNVIRTHPIAIYDYTVCRNFYYVPPDEFLRSSEAALHLEVERFLTNILDYAHAQEEFRRLYQELEKCQKVRPAELDLGTLFYGKI